MYQGAVKLVNTILSAHHNLQQQPTHLNFQRKHTKGQLFVGIFQQNLFNTILSAHHNLQQPPSHSEKTNSKKLFWKIRAQYLPETIVN